MWKSKNGLDDQKICLVKEKVTLKSKKVELNLVEVSRKILVWKLEKLSGYFSSRDEH